MENPITRDNIKVLQKELAEVILLLEKETTNKYPSFYPDLERMKKNIEICIECNFDGINDLYKYLLEDWKKVCDINIGIRNWKIYKEEIDDMAFSNRLFFAKIEKIDKILKANMYISRQWIDKTMIRNMAMSFETYREGWASSIDSILKEGFFTKSELNEIPDDIWTYVKRSGIACSDEALIEWFCSEIPAFYDAKPINIVQYSYGDDALRAFIMTIPF
ncbi:hypothetical protein [Konateibacter massiliensis]|uniref:hypothetical protein n=1 Tax=Konateibacter massiliensis TaxID=2002841 RepID=UPI000C15FFF5|nr:hypothetical protein [Konateibacter massiliensis]